MGVGSVRELARLDWIGLDWGVFLLSFFLSSFFFLENEPRINGWMDE